MTRILLFLSVSIVLSLKAHQRSISLQEALDKKYVKAEAVSLGSYHGFCIELHLKNLNKDALSIRIEAGRRLNSIDDQMQDILIVKEELIVLNGKASKVILVKGYCCQADNRCPTKGSKFAIHKMADSSLIKVARYLSLNGFEEGVEQDAVWAVSEKRSAATIATRDDSLLKPLRLMVASINHEILPWYRIISNKYISPNNRISSTPVLLQGELEYSLQQDAYVTLNVFNEKGMPVCLIKSQWKRAETKASYKLDIPLLGLEKGKYTIALNMKDEIIAEKEFEL